MELSDETVTELQALLEDMNAGNQIAFNSVMTRIENRFRHLTHRMLKQYPGVRRWEDTDDVFQTSLIRLHRSLCDTQPESVRGLIGLAATQVRRTLIDLARHYFGVYGKGRLHHSDVEGRAADDPHGPVDVPALPSHEPFSLDDWTEFHHATAQLPESEKEVFELSWYAGLDQADVANLIGVSRRTVIRRLHRARALLKQALADRPVE